MRDFKQEHARRQQSKKRIAFEIDRKKWDALGAERQAILLERARQAIDRILRIAQAADRPIT